MLEVLSAVGALVVTFVIISVIRTEVADRRDHKRYITQLRKINRGYYGDVDKSVRELREAQHPTHNPFGNIR